MRTRVWVFAACLIVVGSLVIVTLAGAEPGWRMFVGVVVLSAVVEGATFVVLFGTFVALLPVWILLCKLGFIPRIQVECPCCGERQRVPIPEFRQGPACSSCGEELPPTPKRFAPGFAEYRQAPPRP